MLYSLSIRVYRAGRACLLDNQEPLNKAEVGGLDIDSQGLFNRVARIGRKGAKGVQLLWRDCER